jgi:hypothetical protein
MGDLQTSAKMRGKTHHKILTVYIFCRGALKIADPVKSIQNLF